MGPYKTVQQIIKANKQHGRYFFSPATMAGFNSHVHDGVYGGRYFIVSNQRDEDAPRYYQVHRAQDDGGVDAEPIQAYDGRDEFSTLIAARAVALTQVVKDEERENAGRIVSDVLYLQGVFVRTIKLNDLYAIKVYEQANKSYLYYPARYILGYWYPFENTNSALVSFTIQGLAEAWFEEPRVEAL